MMCSFLASLWFSGQYLRYWQVDNKFGSDLQGVIYFNYRVHKLNYSIHGYKSNNNVNILSQNREACLSTVESCSINVLYSTVHHTIFYVCCTS